MEAEGKDRVAIRRLKGWSHCLGLVPCPADRAFIISSTTTFHRILTPRPARRWFRLLARRRRRYEGGYLMAVTVLGGLGASLRVPDCGTDRVTREVLRPGCKRSRKARGPMRISVCRCPSACLPEWFLESVFLKFECIEACPRGSCLCWSWTAFEVRGLSVPHFSVCRDAVTLLWWQGCGTWTGSNPVHHARTRHVGEMSVSL